MHVILKVEKFYAVSYENQQFPEAPSPQPLSLPSPHRSFSVVEIQISIFLIFTIFSTKNMLILLLLEFSGLGIT